MDGVDGTSGFWVGEIKQNHDNTVDEFATKASKAVSSIQSIYLSQADEVIEPSLVKVAPYIQGILDTHYVKCCSNSNGSMKHSDNFKDM